MTKTYDGALAGVDDYVRAAIATDLGLRAVDAELDRRTREVMATMDDDLLVDEDDLALPPERFRRRLLHGQVEELRASALDAVLARLRAAAGGEVAEARRLGRAPRLDGERVAWLAWKAQAARERALAELDDLDERLEARDAS